MALSMYPAFRRSKGMNDSKSPPLTHIQHYHGVVDEAVGDIDKRVAVVGEIGDSGKQL